MKKTLNHIKGVMLFFFLAVYSQYSLASYECIQAYRPKIQYKSIIQKKYGFIPEFQSTQMVLLSYMGSGAFFQKMHQSILANLPKNIKAYSVIPSAVEEANPRAYYHALAYKEDMKEFINSGRLKLIEIPVDENFVVGIHSNWIRDFMSQLALTRDKNLKFINTVYFEPLADHTDQVMRKKLILEIKKLTGLSVDELELPFVFEWGNWENDGRKNIFVSEVLLKNNRDMPSFSNMNYEAIKQEFASWFHRHIDESIKINWIKPLPLEPTGHVDLMFKFINENEVILSSSPNKYDQEQLTKAKLILESLGKKIHTIEVAVADIEKIEGRNPLAPFRSYTNSLIVRDGTNGKSTAFVPSYANESYPELASYDKKAQEIYESLGFKVVMIPSGDAILEEGAVHCATCTIPKLDQKEP